MKTTYSYEITINFDLSDEDFELVTEAMKNHSDTEFYTTQGEFWYGNMNRNRWRREAPPGEYDDNRQIYSATTYQMQRVIKSLEPYMSGWIFDRERCERGRELYNQLYITLKQAIEHGNEFHAGQEIVR